MKSSPRLSLSAASACLALAICTIGASVHAQTDPVNMIASNGSGQDWSTTFSGVSPFWSDGLAAHSGADYVVGLFNSTTFVPYVVRTPTTDGPHTFPGTSLTINGGQFNLSILGANTNFTTSVSDLRFTNGGVLVNAVISTQTLTGGLNFYNTEGDTYNYSVIRTAGTAATGNIRNITVESKITGGGIVRLLQRGTVTLSNAEGPSGSSTSTFNGTWHVGGSATVNGMGAGSTAGTLTNTSATITTLTATTVNSLGINSSVTVDLWSVFDVDYDWATTGSLTLVDNGLNIDSAVVMNLHQNITVGSLSIAGVSLGVGTYTYSDLKANATYSNYFADGGSGMITVIPEPNVVALFALGSFGVVLLLARRRRLFSTR